MTQNVTASKSISVAALFRWLRFWRPGKPARRPLTSDLLRLGETAPHLLADMGFHLDPSRSNAQAEVWHRSGQTIVVDLGPSVHRLHIGR